MILRLIPFSYKLSIADLKAKVYFVVGLTYLDPLFYRNYVLFRLVAYHIAAIEL